MWLTPSAGYLYPHCLDRRDSQAIKCCCALRAQAVGVGAKSPHRASPPHGPLLHEVLSVCELLDERTSSSLVVGRFRLTKASTAIRNQSAPLLFDRCLVHLVTVRMRHTEDDTRGVVDEEQFVICPFSLSARPPVAPCVEVSRSQKDACWD